MLNFELSPDLDLTRDLLRKIECALEPFSPGSFKRRLARLAAVIGFGVNLGGVIPPTPTPDQWRSAETLVKRGLILLPINLTPMYFTSYRHSSLFKGIPIAGG